MSETPINITALNDFIFCPLSIYFHLLYDDIDKMTCKPQSYVVKCCLKGVIK